ncbi:MULTISPECIES: fumarylacetoacetate hydrolase family protein [unclassified Polaromonas]|jgi:2-keto-4-pentenoate hydratase/2-oxohepta-3-ene-1,7-dioic acid hydratase in catechol pathway|uniref:fumarylacetoacetate hydrolase family protein n=1 Tax=unclassified Polaromonas TaxID=2638319 RepID=UPI000BC72446|nr:MULTISPECIES: fumarylacetoacetate hydrolase family protein [unclassified Polaromonas]OYY39632.1 MAG: hydrolase [Polaromonas sp. 35-63-35]OYZ22376.1 MAG: hydrolase [Polaromonas sp. 16-63-31]OYZ81403.1 MAG: hydrolase [Polaromonas sp. 24-63-21]OZA52371.1 MAG: hydrolase [Polaromonas sp. 17-63-33]OZA88762.1 MAG: hydrolase [Polaromonas sp. 39-63-25]
MKIVAYRLKGRSGVGLVSADLQQVQPFDLPEAQSDLGAQALIEMQARGDTLPALLPAIALSEVQIIAPLPKPRRNIFCVGKNYFAHAKEFAGSGFDSSAKSGGDIPADPIIFTKVPESVVGPGAAIEMPAVSTAIDYEAELAVIIGRGGKGIAAKDAMAHVWGYTIVNDITARDWQSRHQQWHMGKSFDTFCPMGPWLVSADELDGTKTRVRCYVNGEERQNASTVDLIFDIPKLIETLSAGITLYPGDVIATGTPVGVGIGFKPPKYLQAGDVVRVEIDGIGSLENPVR